MLLTHSYLFGWIGVVSLALLVATVLNSFRCISILPVLTVESIATCNPPHRADPRLFATTQRLLTLEFMSIIAKVQWRSVGALGKREEGVCVGVC